MILKIKIIKDVSKKPEVWARKIVKETEETTIIYRMSTSEKSRGITWRKIFEAVK